MKPSSHTPHTKGLKIMQKRDLKLEELIYIMGQLSHAQKIGMLWFARWLLFCQRAGLPAWLESAGRDLINCVVRLF
jgi:hypothetical protein